MLRNRPESFQEIMKNKNSTLQLAKEGWEQCRSIVANHLQSFNEMVKNGLANVDSASVLEMLKQLQIDNQLTMEQRNNCQGIENVYRGKFTTADVTLIAEIKKETANESHKIAHLRTNIHVFFTLKLFDEAGQYFLPDDKKKCFHSAIFHLKEAQKLITAYFHREYFRNMPLSDNELCLRVQTAEKLLEDVNLWLSIQALLDQARQKNDFNESLYLLNQVIQIADQHNDEYFLIVGLYEKGFLLTFTFDHLFKIGVQLRIDLLCEAINVCVLAFQHLSQLSEEHQSFKNYYIKALYQQFSLIVDATLTFACKITMQKNDYFLSDSFLSNVIQMQAQLCWENPDDSHLNGKLLALKNELDARANAKLLALEDELDARMTEQFLKELPDEADKLQLQENDHPKLKEREVFWEKFFDSNSYKKGLAGYSLFPELPKAESPASKKQLFQPLYSHPGFKNP